MKLKKLFRAKYIELYFMVFIVIVYRLVLNLIYSRIIYPLYRYQGDMINFNNDWTFQKQLISWLLLIPVPFILMRNMKKDSVSNTVWTILILINFIPSTIVYLYNSSTHYLYYVFYYICFTLAMFLVRPIKINLHIKYVNSLLNVVAIIISLSIIWIWSVYAKFHIQLNVIDVYQTRSMASTYMIPSILAYIFSMSKIVVPIFLIYSLYNQKCFLVIYFVVIQIMSFFIDGSKGTLFILIVAIALYFMLGKGKCSKMIFAGSFAMIGLAAIVQYLLSGKYTIASLIFRRIMFEPNLLNEGYFLFFNESQFDYFRTSIPLFGDSPYSNIPKLIGLMYDGSSFNNGLFSDAWSNFGVVGVIFFPFLIVFVLKIIDGATTKIPLVIAIVPAIEVALLFISSSFFTIMLSHGVVLGYIVLYLIDKKWDMKT